VLVLRYPADLPVAEVAATLGCSVGTVKSTASRGAARLARILTQNEWTATKLTHTPSAGSQNWPSRAPLSRSELAFGRQRILGREDVATWHSGMVPT
jgi:beta-lactamase class A